MIISEKQIMQLMATAADYQHKIELMICKGIAVGDPENAVESIRNLLLNIRSQQSEKLKEVVG